MNIYGIKDCTNGRIINVFLADDDIKAVRMNTVVGDANNSSLRRGFNLVSLGSLPTETNICRLVDCESKLNELLEKEGL